MGLQVHPVEEEAEPGELGVELLAKPVATVGDCVDLGPVGHPAVDSGAEQVLHDRLIGVHGSDVGAVDAIDLSGKADPDLAPSFLPSTSRESADWRALVVSRLLQLTRSNHAAIEFNEDAVDTWPLGEWQEERLSGILQPRADVLLGLGRNALQDAKNTGSADVLAIVLGETSSGEST